MDWLQQIVGALGDGDAWRLVGRVARIAATSEVLQFSAVAVPVCVTSLEFLGP